MITSLRELNKWWKEWKLPIIIGVSILFFLIVILFQKTISRWLENKKDWYVPSSIEKPSLQQKKTWIIPKKNEARCRAIFQRIFQRPFPSSRPSFMRRASSNYCLELDGYCPELKLAFEYNGIQHYQFSPRFHKKMEDFLEQKKRDDEKIELCKKAGITLIVIPYTVPFNDLENYIIKELNKIKVSI